MTVAAIPDRFAGVRRVTPRHAAAEPPGPGSRSPLGRDEVRRRRAEAAQAWADALGGATSCTLAKDGRSHPTAKFHEGRAAALGDLLRRIGPGPGVDPEAIVADAAALAAEWAARTPPGGGNRDWDAYRAGGVDALRDLSGA